MTINVALVGCGGFVRHTHLANLQKNKRFHVHAAVDVNLESAKAIADACSSAYWTDDADRAINDPDVQLVFISTPHHTHADLSIRSARAGKHIYCEKPMGLTEQDCLAVIDAVNTAGVQYIAGYNRGGAPFLLQARELLAKLDEPMLIHHRFADWNPYNWGWLIDESQSGGRVVGEGGHSLDMMCRLAGQNPVRLYAEGGNFAEPSPTNAPDSANIIIGFPDGSSGVLMLSSVGNNGYPKEEIVVTCANHTIAIFGFERMVIHSPAGAEEFTLPAADKGHAAMLDQTADAIEHGTRPAAGLDEALRAARLTMAALRSIRTHTLQTLDG